MSQNNRWLRRGRWLGSGVLFMLLAFLFLAAQQRHVGDAAQRHQQDVPVAAEPGAAASAGIVAAAHPGDSQVPASAEGAVPSAAANPPALIFGQNRPTHISDLPPGTFLTEVQALDDATQAKVLAQLDTLAIPHADLASLRIGPAGRLFYVCRAAQAAAAETAQTPVVAGAAGIAVSPSPLNLHSRLGSAKVLYLAFHGPDISGTVWNFGKAATFRCRAWSADADETTFSTSELATIEEIWKRVSESFAAFDIDVTTVQPSVWNANTGYAVITPTTTKDSVQLPHAGSGGVAYVGVFGETPEYVYGTAGCYSPLWVTAYTGGSTMYMAETIAHEFGHNIGLSHDGTTLPSVADYYGNHVAWPSSSRTWGPVMGGGTINDLHQWSRGQYYGANNTQDDLHIIANKLGYRPADRGATRTTASALQFSATDVIQDSGVIERTAGVDFFQFSGRPGRFSVTAQPFQGSLSSQWGATLDPEVQLLDSTGQLLAQYDDPTGTGATITYDLPFTGTYYLRVAPTAATVGNPTQSGPTGFTTYGVLGSYTLTGTIASPTSPSLRVTGNGQVIPAGTTAMQSGNGTYLGTILRSVSATQTFVLQNIGGQALNITGARIVGTSGMTLNAIANPVIAAGGQLEVTVTFPGTTTIGLYQDVLSIPAGGAAAAFTCALSVRVVVAPLVVDALSSSAEFPGNPITLSGSQLTGAEVRCNGALATVLSSSATSLSVLVPVTTAGITTLEVSGPNGVASLPFTVCGIPIITSATPAVVVVGNSTQVTFSGSWLTQATITLGGQSATVTSTDANTVICTVPSLAAGTYDVLVSGPGDVACPSRANSTATALLTYVAPVGLTALQPASGPIAGGNHVTVTGVNLNNATILFDGQPATIVTRTATSIVVSAPPHAVGTAQVNASNAGFSSATLAYSYRAMPQITSLTPTSLSLAGGTVTVIGSALDEAVVNLAGITVPMSAGSSTEITVQIPAQAASGVYVVQLQTPGGLATSTLSLVASPASDATGTSDAGGGGGSGCGAGGGLAILVLMSMGLWGLRRSRG